jgi:uncharacterized membrane protein YccC
MKRISYWTVGLAMIGGLIGAQGMAVVWRDVLLGIAVGALLGFCLGFLFHKWQKGSTES